MHQATILEQAQAAATMYMQGYMQRYKCDASEQFQLVDCVGPRALT